MDKWERRWADPDYDWTAEEYVDDWHPEPETKKNVYQFVREYMEAAKNFFWVTDPRTGLAPGEFREWLFEIIEDEYICLPYEEQDIKQAIEEIWEEL